MNMRKGCLLYLLMTSCLMAAEGEALKESPIKRALSLQPIQQEIGSYLPNNDLKNMIGVNRGFKHALQSIKVARVLPFDLTDEDQGRALRQYLTKALSQGVRVSLQLRDTTDTGIERLSPFNCIKTLNLFGTQITNVGIVNYLARLTNIEDIDLGAALEMTDAGMATLGSFTSLRTLRLLHTGVKKITVLMGLIHLETLDLSSTGVKNIAALVELINLRTLNLSRTGVTNITVLGRLINLLNLDLSDTDVTNITALMGLMHLETLDLSNTRVTDEGMAAIGLLTSLRILNLSNTRVTDKTLKELAKLTNLQTLYLFETEATYEGTRVLVERLTGLKTIYFSGARFTRADMLEFLLRIKSLPALDLPVAPVTGVGMTALAHLPS